MDCAFFYFQEKKSSYGYVTRQRRLFFDDNGDNILTGSQYSE